VRAAARSRHARVVRLAPVVLVLPALALDPAPATATTYDAGQALQTSVTAVGQLARSYGWSVASAVDATTLSSFNDTAPTEIYTVTARAGAMTESGWTLAGEVTVTNPDPADAVVADVTVATDLGGAAGCTVTGGDDVVVAAGGTVTLPYTCAFGSAPASSGTVTATTAWDPAGEATATSVDATAPASFVARENGATVAVVDDHAVAGQRVVLDPALGWAPDLVRSWTYPLALAGGAPGACASHTSTATVDLVDGTDPAASTTVRACTPEVLPAQAFGSPVGSVRARCQGRVRARMTNRSGEAVVYVLRVGRDVHRITVRPLSTRSFVTRARAFETVTLKADGRRLDRVRVPQRCAGSVTLEDLGL
jgi:hypothetical protein